MNHFWIRIFWMNNFWKCWKGKFGKGEAHAKVIEGCNDSSDIAHVFKNFFNNTNIPNNLNVHAAHKAEFVNLLEKYDIGLDDEQENEVRIEDIELALQKLKKG